MHRGQTRMQSKQGPPQPDIQRIFCSTSRLWQEQLPSNRAYLERKHNYKRYMAGLGSATPFRKGEFSLSTMDSKWSTGTPTEQSDMWLYTLPHSVLCKLMLQVCPPLQASLSSNPKKGARLPEPRPLSFHVGLIGMPDTLCSSLS